MKNVFATVKEITEVGVKQHLKSPSSRVVIAAITVGSAVGSRNLKTGAIIGAMTASAFVAKTALDTLEDIEVVTLVNSGTEED